MTLEQLKTAIETAIRAGVNPQTEVKVGTDFDGVKTEIDRNLTNVAWTKETFSLFREV
jgi:hypothetical protein